MPSQVILDTQETVSSIVHLLLDEMSENISPQFRVKLFVLATDQRWHLLNNDDAVDEVWQAIRADDALTDFIIRGTSLLMLHEASAVNSRLGPVVMACAESLGWVSKAALIDSAIAERSGTVDYFTSAFAECPWFLFLYLLSTIRHV